MSTFGVFIGCLCVFSCINVALSNDESTEYSNVAVSNNDTVEFSKPTTCS